MSDKVQGRAGGEARAEVITSEKAKKIAKMGAAARWGHKATHKGNFKDEFGIDVECYVLDDENKTAVISQTGMVRALGMSTRGDALTKFLGTKAMASSGVAELQEKARKYIKFQWSSGVAEVPPALGYGFDVTFLIDICQAIVKAEADGKLSKRYENIARQAHIILGASAKAGIKGLVYALAGYNPTIQEVIDAFKLYVLEEAKKYEPEFPNELYLEWHRLYSIPVHQRGKPWQFKYLTVNHVYTPLANSNGKILELTRIMKAKDGDRKKKLFQFLNEIGARALRMQLGRILEMAQSSSSQEEYEAKVIARFGGQPSLELVVIPKPINENETAQPSPADVEKAS